MPLARKAGLSRLGDLVQKLRSGSEALVVDVVEAMTTNESFFFRDKHPFALFRDTAMPALLAARAPQRQIRIWCAAASTGQEPYSLAMCLHEMGAPIAGWRIELIATDLSTEVLEKARAGLYNQFTNSKCSAGCRLPCWSNISGRSANSGKSPRISAAWCSTGR